MGLVIPIPAYLNPTATAKANESHTVAYSGSTTTPGQSGGGCPRIGMTIWVWVPDIRRVFDPTGTSMRTIYICGWYPYLT
jgi:hypothetical protein